MSPQDFVEWMSTVDKKVAQECIFYRIDLMIVLSFVIFSILFLCTQKYIQFLCIRMAKNQKILEDKYLKKLLSVQYNNELFKNASQECSICLDIFSSTAVECKVTPLPCSDKHLFHTVCLKGWLTRDEQENKCPICRKLIDDQEYQTFAKEFV